MESITDVERGSWLAARAGAWATVGGVVGTDFEAYARIFHPVDASQEALAVTYAVIEYDSLAWDGDTVNPSPATASAT